VHRARRVRARHIIIRAILWRFHTRIVQESICRSNTAAVLACFVPAVPRVAPCFVFIETLYIYVDTVLICDVFSSLRRSVAGIAFVFSRDITCPWLGATFSQGNEWALHSPVFWEA
jgi:hypothetical protein